VKLLALLTVATITAAAGAALTTKLQGPVTPTIEPQSVTVSVEELHDQIDLASLPEPILEDPV
jgi:microcystin degradation protein MlrC